MRLCQHSAPIIVQSSEVTRLGSFRFFNCKTEGFLPLFKRSFRCKTDPLPSLQQNQAGLRSMLKGPPNIYWPSPESNAVTHRLVSNARCVQYPSLCMKGMSPHSPLQAEKRASTYHDGQARGVPRAPLNLSTMVQATAYRSCLIHSQTMVGIERVCHHSVFFDLYLHTNTQ